MYLPRRVTISWDGGSVELYGPDAWSGLVVSSDGITGWDSAPDAKVTSTERQSGNGAYDIRASDIHYQSRVVTIGVGAYGRTRDETLTAMRSLSAAHGRLVSMRVVDALTDTFCEMGYAHVTWDPLYYEGACTGTLTVTFPRPERLSTTPHRAYLSPGASAGALAWHADAPHGLLWPLSYGVGGAVANVATLRNDGTSTAYPVITASGDMAGLVLTDTSTGAQLAWDGHVGTQPVTLDCLSRTASVAGVDASRLLSARGFPSVPPGGEVTLALSATGSGTVEVEWRDTYI